MGALSFTEENGKWVATATVNGPFNLHIERAEAGAIELHQRTTNDGNYAPCVGVPERLLYKADKVIDYDFGQMVYPKSVRIVSYKAVTTATITEATS